MVIRERYAMKVVVSGGEKEVLIENFALSIPRKCVWLSDARAQIFVDLTCAASVMISGGNDDDNDDSKGNINIYAREGE
eukprot:CAMPEP_0172314982 /NCGR_PEP_ID=MMETSP1058-20130122/23727_1 /TAXON_ID=83371 /ORGANISM="Detonula confervacea, Strain CCMP 353" /LENGTH=78 /DNA_ID=CAMNT_0013028951 /DNA_START=96 /DNA_END=332 /DNA_ORIENTATION=+